MEKIQKDLTHNHRLIPVQELEEKAVVLKQLGETLTDLKGEEGAGHRAGWHQSLPAAPCSIPPCGLLMATGVGRLELLLLPCTPLGQVLLVPISTAPQTGWVGRDLKDATQPCQGQGQPPASPSCSKP